MTDKEFFSKLLSCELSISYKHHAIQFDYDNDLFVFDGDVFDRLPESINDVQYIIDWINTRLKLKSMVKNIKTTLNLIDAIQN